MHQHATFAVVEVEFDRLPLVDVQVGEPHGRGEQHQQQQELELLPDLLHGEAQHPGSHILRQPPGFRLSKRKQKKEKANRDSLVVLLQL